jgi:hypothetical protein
MNTSTYQVTQNDMKDTVIIRTDADGRVWSFLADPANADYQAYLATLPS